MKPEWVRVESGVSQGYVLGPLLLVLYIDDLSDTVKNRVEFYTDDPKILVVIIDWNNVTNVYKDLSSICEWPNLHTCINLVRTTKFIHFERRLEKTEREKDLEVYFTPDFNWKDHILEITARANIILGSLKKLLWVETLLSEKNLYISQVRPHLEYAVQIWSPTNEMGIGLIEKVQARATEIIHSMRNLRYEGRLTKWEINRLEDRRVREDLIL